MSTTDMPFVITQIMVGIPMSMAMRLVAQNPNPGMKRGARQICKIADANNLVRRVVSQYLDDISKLPREVLVDEEETHVP